MKVIKALLFTILLFAIGLALIYLPIFFGEIGAIVFLAILFLAVFFGFLSGM